MNPILFEKNTEPEMRALLSSLDYEYKVLFSGYAMVQTKRRVKFVCIIEKIVVKHQHVKTRQLTLESYE